MKVWYYNIYIMCVSYIAWSVYFNTNSNQNAPTSCFLCIPQWLIGKNAVGIKSANASKVHDILK